LTDLITTWLELYCGTAVAMINSWWCRCGQRWGRVCRIRPTGIFIIIIRTVLYTRPAVCIAIADWRTRPAVCVNRRPLYTRPTVFGDS